MSQFKFPLKATAKLKHSGESGEIIGRAEYTHSEDMYFIRYQAGDGRQVEAWWGESAIDESTVG